MNEHDVVLKLANYGDHIRRYEIMLPNVFIQHDSEADLFCIRKSGLCDEFEIKTSRKDFLNDKKKFVRFRSLEPHESRNGIFDWDNRHQLPNYKAKHQALLDGDMCVNYFWYAVLEGVADVSDVPAFAGLIIVRPEKCIQIKKMPTKLHSKKMPIEERYNVARKSTYRYWSLKNTMTNAAT